MRISDWSSDVCSSDLDEWYDAIPEAIRPAKEQPYYHLFAESDDSAYIAYVSQQNLVSDAEHGPVDHPQIDALFDGLDRGRYRVRAIHRHQALDRKSTRLNSSH